MNPSHVSAQKTTLESLSYPGIGQRMIEAALGSVRRDALAILRGAPRAELEPGKFLSSVQFTHGDGVVRFSFGSALEAVHINTSRGDLHISGQCEMGQRLSRFATRALVVHHARAKNACVQQATRLLAGDDHGQTLSSSYDATRYDEHREGGYNCGTVERGRITTEHGVLSLSSEEREYRIGGLMGQQMDSNLRSALLARQHMRIFNPPYDGGSALGHGGMWGGGSMMGGGWAISDDPFLPPSSTGRIDSAKATFSNPQIEAMLKLFDVSEQLGEVDFDRRTVRSLLAWAKRAQENR